MSDKIVKQLPVVLQTKAVRNFFEATVEQLYSEANTVPLAGFIGKKTGDDAKLQGAFIKEDNADRRQYNLTPAVNNINPVTGDSENLIFYDEFIDTLKVYGVNTSNHNKLFGSRYRSFVPPIDIDKFVNYQEYYWHPAGLDALEIGADNQAPLNLEKDVLGKKEFTYDGTTFRNGMTVIFADSGFTIPANATTLPIKAGIAYIVQGVGTGIKLVEKSITSSTEYGGANLAEPDYIIQQRGAANKNAWSRVNHWYHRDNFLEAGDELPDRAHRAKRPIIEFDADLELFDHGTTSYGEPTVNVTGIVRADIENQPTKHIDTRELRDGDVLLFLNEDEDAKRFLYTVSGVNTGIVLIPTSSTPIAVGQTVTIAEGNVFKGIDYIFNGTDYVQAQRKIKTNQAPLFNLYDDAGNALNHNGLYNNSDFAGNKIFGYKEGVGVKDTELGFPLTYTPYKSVSEITFENYIHTDRSQYTPFGTHTAKTVLGTYYYKLLKDVPEYHSSFKESKIRNEQCVITTHYITQFDVDDNKLIYNIGATPDILVSRSSGYDILVKVNGSIVTDYTYVAPTDIKFNTFTFKPGDVIDVEVGTATGISKITDSRYDLPLSWRSNPYNKEIELVAEPDYMSHFKRYIERQDGFTGSALGSNNFASTAKEIVHAKDIVQTDQDLMVAAFALDDQPHNLVDALRFTAREYEKFRARLIKEINQYYERFDTANLSKEYILEQALRSLISFSIGKDIFGTSYVLPFGDNYLKQEFDVADINSTVYVLDDYADLDEITNSLLVYHVTAATNTQDLLTVESDYTISSVNPITITVTKQLELGDSIVTKLYDKDRDSAECPATPSTLGLYTLCRPRVETDNSFKTPQQLLIGHDCSKTLLQGDIRDEILLEFEIRLYNSAAQQFRSTDSFPRLNVGDVRSGAFRSTNQSPREYADLLRNSFTNWTKSSNVDYSTNEFYDANDTLTWNYRGEQDLPGHWRGWFEYYYDTVRPHTHPWEMLGFYEEPTWWVSEYGTNYTMTNEVMWKDLEQGIIRQGDRENFVNGDYLTDNPWRRIGLLNLLPVDTTNVLLSPGQITGTGSTTKTETWTNLRPSSSLVSDAFRDIAGTNNLPNGINITYGSSSSLRVLFDAFDVGNVSSKAQAGTFWDYDGTIGGASSLTQYATGFQEGFDGFETPYIFVEDITTRKTYQLYNYTAVNLTDPGEIIREENVLVADTTIGLTSTGTPLLNVSNVSSWQDEDAWHYSNTFRNNANGNGTYFIEPEHAGLTEWDKTEHSPIVGWAFDGLPIYGPYGYNRYATDGTLVGVDANDAITPIKSAFELRTGQRSSGPLGIYTGEFVEDYTYNVSLGGTAGYVGHSQKGGIAKYNMRWGVTPESPDTPIYFYVATIDTNEQPMFPYAIGGTQTASPTIFEPHYYAAPVEQEANNNGSIVGSGEIVAVSSSLVITPSTTASLINNPWRFGDGAPVENAWKYSVNYPFAVTEALLLSQPGRFVTLFSDPLRNTSPVLQPNKIINTVDRTPFDFRNENHFGIHGSVNSAGDVVTNVGYSQFIHSWLTYQNLNTTTDFADKLKNVNIKLAHRVAGFTDKDTLIVKADQQGLTSTTNSLIIPSENVDVVVHASPYKNRNFYTGLTVEKTPDGYKVRGYDKNAGYFNVLRRNKTGATTSVEVGGDAVDFVNWEPLVSYQKNTIVSYNNGYYQAPTLVTSTQTFTPSLWNRLPSLPQTGSVKGVLFLDDLPYIDRVDYQTEFTTFQEVVDLIVGLGAYQESIGYNFGDFDTEIADVRNWNYVVKQFLFWVAGGWENNNTIDLSPLASNVKFTSTTGMVAEIKRVDKNQFTLIDQDGRAIQPSECEIVREGNTIEIAPPEGIQIYGAMLFTKEIEHALVFDNVTEFNDTLFDPVYNQGQTRFKIKGKRTANWSGLFSSEGFIIQGDELRPNLDNMAQSLGRYHELGFIPVEKQIYEQARGLFGYQEREYLNNLELEDDDQFEFFKGMLQSKGTLPSLSKLSKSKNIISGDMAVYDEWAIKVGDFGDLENDQSIELKLVKSDVKHDPQLITLAFPEDTTGTIEQVDIISTEHTYFEAPTIEIAPPVPTANNVSNRTQATATALLGADGTLGAINVTYGGTGYTTAAARLNVVAGNISIANVSTQFATSIAASTDPVLDTAISGLSLTNLNITAVAAGSSNANIAVSLDVSSITSLANIATIVNENATINSHITANTVESKIQVGTNIVRQSILTLEGTDFILAEAGSTLSGLNLVAGRYQPKQRYSIAAVGDHPTKGTGATTANDITVKVNDAVVNSTYWTYDAGSRQIIPFKIATSNASLGDQNASRTTVIRGNVTVPLNDPISSDNIEKVDNISYPYASVFVNGEQIRNYPGDQRFDLTTTDLTLYDVDRLADSGISNDANVFVLERPTVEFAPSYFDDKAGASLNIKVSTNDNIAVTTGIKRLHEITPDIKTDDTILIDIDDTTRFLKKPIGERQESLWPTTSYVNAKGITDSKYTQIPNAGYVNSTTVDFSSFDVPSIGQMFRNEIVIHPEKDDLVHVAVAENEDWNVYKFKEFASVVQFVEQEENDLTAHLYTTDSLFSKTTDENQIASGIDSTRFLDYHIAIKDAIVDNKFVVWVNEQVVNQKQVRLSNITATPMIESTVSSIGPNNNLAITNISSGISSFAIGTAVPAGDGTGTVTVTTDIQMLDSAIGGTVGFATGNVTTDERYLHGNSFVASNVNIEAGTFTINEPNIAGTIPPANLTVRYFNRTTITAANHGFASGEMVKVVAGAYSGQYYVEGASQNTFMIDTPFITGGPTTGNVLHPEFKITTTEDHGITNDYAGKKIAVHNADQRFYNGVYRVKNIPTSNTILVWNSFPFADEANTNVNGTPATTCVVTTLDHDVISLNNSSIKIDNINSLDGMIDSLNDAFEARGDWISHVGSFQMRMPMLKFPMQGPGGLTPNQIGGATPRVTNFGSISKKNVNFTGVKTASPRRAQKIGFNKKKYPDGLRRGKKVRPRTVSSGARTMPRTTTLNTTSFNPVIPNIVSSGIGAAVFAQGGAGMGGNGKPNTSIGTGYNSGVGLQLSPNINISSFLGFGHQQNPPSAVPTPPPLGAAGMFNRLITAVKIKPKKQTPIKPNPSTGSPVLTGTAVHVAPPPKCGELVIPVPPPPPVPPNLPPNGADDKFTTAQDTPVSGNVLANDTDPEGDPLTSVNFTDPSFGTLSGTTTSGAFTYTPNAGYAGTDAFFYDSTDGTNTNKQKVTIEVSVNPPKPTIYEKCEYQEQSTSANRTGHSGQYDYWTYMIPASGPVKIIMDMYSAADRLEAHQVNSKGQQTGKVLVSTSSGVRKASDAEKSKLTSGKTQTPQQSYPNLNPTGRGGAYAGPGSYTPTYNPTLTDFRQEGDKIAYCGVLEFNFNPNAGGNYLVVKVRKDSSVYRYMICYPTTTNTGNAIPPSTPAGNYSGSSQPAPSWHGYNSTPTYQPTGQATTKPKNTVGVINVNPGSGGGGWNRNQFLGSVTYSHNYGGFSVAPMAGYSHVPSVFKKTVKTVNPQNIGREADLTDNRYVNNTMQRVSGGRIIPLSAPPQQPIQIANRGINGLNLSQYPGSSHLANSGTMKNITVAHQILQIASSNYDLQNLSNPGSSSGFGTAGTNGFNTNGTSGAGGSGVGGFNDSFNGFTTSVGGNTAGFNRAGTNTPGSTSNIPGYNDAVFTTTPAGPPTIIPGSDIGNNPYMAGLDPNSFGRRLTSPETLNSDDAPINELIDWTQDPEIEFTPKKKITNPDGTFTYVPDGPPARAKISRPTPSVLFTEDGVGNLTPGDEFIINNKKITIPAVPGAVLNEIECNGGFGYTASGTSSKGQRAVKVSSCSAAPITVRDGCRGGAYKEVLDFHIVRTFQQLSATAAPFNSQTDMSGLTSSTSGTHVAGVTSATVSTTTTNSGNTITQTPTMTTNTEFTGGSGYVVGDRLRVVGGTPVPSPFGKLHELCVELPGAFYSSEANVKVFVGDGTTPGASASVGSVKLDAKGGIQSVNISNPGFGYDPSRPPVIRVVDVGKGSTEQPNMPAKIRPVIKMEVMNAQGNFVPSQGSPDRVAKFVVTAVHPDTKAILGLRVIDRGVYKEFPSDLSQGIPLEYDYPNIGDGISAGGSGLGSIDPITGESLGDPGNYAPGSGKYGDLTSHGESGSGARIYLTAREIPDCSEKADVLSKLGIPGQEVSYPVTQHLADLLNTALLNAGYDPNDINFDVSPINDDIDELVLNAPGYDGIEFDELTPGFLDKLGIPIGDYNPDVGDLQAVDGTPQNDENLRDKDDINNLGLGGLNPGSGDGSGFPDGSIPGLGNGGPGNDGLGLGGPGGNGLGGPGTGGNSNIPGFGDDYSSGTDLPEEVMVVYGVDNGGFGSDGSSMLGDANVTYVGDLYQYELRNLDGTFVQSTNDARNAKVLYLESQRYANEDLIAQNDGANISNTVSEFGNVWIDNYQNNGWAYLENGTVIREQEPLVDAKYIKNTIVYDSTTGNKDYDYDMWDPFKGVLPAFVDAEITYTSKSDPVVYTNTRAVFGRPNVGQTWWNTNTVRYNWYEQGTNRERWLNWGSTFPGSAITLFEWVESDVPPLEYAANGGTGTPKNGSEFIIERRIDPATNQYRNYYYYWVQNVSSISTLASQLAGRKTTTFNLARFLADPIGQGLNTVSFISAGKHDPNALSIADTKVASFIMGNLTKTLREDEQNIQINLSRNINPVGLKHASWKLLRENDNNSNVPEDIAQKLIDSLCEIDSAGNKVPADNLSDIERYGVGFRPRQTMFKKPKEARRVLQYILNEILADTKLNTLHPGWDSNLTTNTYVENINWFETIYTDDITNEKIRYDDTYKASFTVESVKELGKLNSSTIVDGTIVMVKAGRNSRFQLWRWSPALSKFSLIAIEKETVKLKDTIFTDDINETMQTELRALLLALKDVVFANTPQFNEVFFELLKYIMGEQAELDWAFKTSYVYIEKEEEDLVQRTGFKPDNFESVIEYMNEVKPYTAKIREYKDGKRAPLEYINEQMVSDYDVPAYPDPALSEVRTLDFHNGADRNIMSNSNDYAKAFGAYSLSQAEWGPTAPVRTNKVSMIFDRVDWRLAAYGHNAASQSYTVSIAENIADINSNSIANVSNVSSNSYSASGRMFKFDPDVRAQFEKDVAGYIYSTNFAVTDERYRSVTQEDYGNVIITDTSNAIQIQGAVESGALAKTLYLIKEKVGGTWQGEELDANVFAMTVSGQDSLMLQGSFGYDTTEFDATSGFGSQFDSMINVENYEGTFTGNSTYREGGITYDGFDGVSFNQMLYGEERPEELVYLSPLENFVMHVTTDPIAYGANNVPIAAISVGPYVAANISNSVANVVTITSPQAATLLNDADTVTLTDTGNTILSGSFTIANVTTTSFEIPLAGVNSTVITNAGDVTITSGVSAVRTEYLVHQDLFGGDEYLRILGDGSGSTTTATAINAWDTEIEVSDASKLPIPKASIPGAVWIDNSERIEYLKISGNKLLGVTRGTRGTTVPNGPVYTYDSSNNAILGNTFVAHPAGAPVVSAGKADVFDASIKDGGSEGFANRDPSVANWLKADGSQKSITDVTNRNTGSGSTIAAFLHGDSVSSVGFDSRPWDSVAWDSI
jgi:hypothetical protein